MKTPISFRLSETAIQQLAELASRYNMSKTDVLETLIGDRAAASDKDANVERRRKAWKPDYELLSKFAVFQKGYSLGWIHFQTRHTPENKMIEELAE